MGGHLMVINIAHDGIKCLSQVFKKRPGLFRQWSASDESLTIVDQNKIVAEISPWNQIECNNAAYTQYRKFRDKNKFAWLPFAIMVGQGLAHLYDNRFDSYANGEKKIRVTQL